MTLDNLIEKEKRQIEFSERYIKNKEKKIDFLEGLKEKVGWHLVNLRQGNDGDLYAENLFFLVRDDFKLPKNFNSALATLFSMKDGEEYINLNVTNDGSTQEESNTEEQVK